MNNKLILILILLLLTSYPVYALSFQDITNFFASIYNSIASFFGSAFSVLTPSTTGSGGGGGGGGGGGSSTLCSSSLSLSITGKDTCTVTATVTSTNCVNRTYEIKNVACSGNITSSSFSKTCTWTVTSGSYTYNLYIDGQYKLSKSISCSKSPPPTCSDGTLYGQCSSTKPKYCDNGNLINKCSQCGCPSGQTCNATTNVCYTPTACSCGSWTNGACGSSGCTSNQRQQTRTCSPTGCTPSDGLGTSKCVADNSCITPSTCDSQCKSQGYGSGTCESGGTFSTTINKSTIVYGTRTWTDAELSFLANHFTLFDFGFEFDTQALKNLKAKNPNMKIIGYKDISGMNTYMDDWTEVNSHEDWFIHDINGNRVQQKDYGWYLMDPASGWKQHYVSYLNAKFAATPEWDGVFIDDCAPELPPWPNWNVPNSYIKSADYARWHADTLGMLQYLKTNLMSGKIAIANTYSTGLTDYINAIDGVMYEGFAHASWSDFNTFGASAGGGMPEVLNTIAQATATGKIVWCDSGTAIPSNPTAADLAQVAKIVKYSYAAFLLAMNGPKAYFNFNDWYSNDGSKGYYSIMDTQLGTPSNSYYSNQNVYMRNFTGGKVLLNPSNSTYTVSLVGNYYLLDGTMVSSVVMAPWSGEILKTTNSGSCQSGETSIGQNGCSSGACCCSGTAPTSIKVDFHTGSWNFGEYDAQTIANTFGMSQSWSSPDWPQHPEWDYTAKMNQVHALNPNYKALVYRNLKDIYDYWTDEWNLTNNSGWLLKNASGSYLRSPTWPENYLVDITNPDYQKWVANTIKSWINQYPFFDGVFADNSIGSDAGEWTWDSTSRPINPKTGTYFTDEEIRNAYIQLHREIKNAIGSKTLVCNGIWNGNRFYERFSSYNEIISNSPLDGIMSEGLWYADGGSWFSENDWLNSLNFLVWIQDNFLKNHLDRYFIGVFYSTGTLPQGCTQEQMTLYGFASTLLGAKNSQNYVSIGGDVYKYPNLLAFVQRLRNIDIGYSENDYHVISGTHVYARDFSKAKVLVNPTASSYTVSLDGNYKTLDGTTVSSITMNAHMGTILLKT